MAIWSQGIHAIFVIKISRQVLPKSYKDYKVNNFRHMAISTIFGPGRFGGVSGIGDKLLWK